MTDGPIETVATILDRMDDHTFHATLPNGKVIVAHVPRRLSELSPVLEVGDKVKLEMTPFDFEKGRVEGRAE